MPALGPVGNDVTVSFEAARAGDAVRPAALTWHAQTAVAERTALVDPDDRLMGVAELMLDLGTSDAVVLEPRMDRPVGVPPGLEVARNLGWGRG